MFDPAWKLALGLVTGLVFGFLLQKGRVAKFRTIVGQFLLADFTVAKIMATAMAVGAVGVYAMVAMGWASLHIKPALLGGVLLGGVLFGIGMAILGYCPGTTVAACGEGRRDAMVGVLGMLAGAGAYVALSPRLRPVIHALADWGKLTIPEAAGTPPWIWIAGLVITVGVAMTLLERRWPESRAPSAIPTDASSRGEHALSR